MYTSMHGQFLASFMAIVQFIDNSMYVNDKNKMKRVKKRGNRAQARHNVYVHFHICVQMSWYVFFDYSVHKYGILFGILRIAYKIYTKTYNIRVMCRLHVNNGFNLTLTMNFVLCDCLCALRI